MKLTLELSLDNAAFESPSGNEVARILRKYAALVEHEDVTPGRALIHDLNGNKVGKLEITDDWKESK